MNEVGTTGYLLTIKKSGTVRVLHNKKPDISYESKIDKDLAAFFAEKHYVPIINEQSENELTLAIGAIQIPLKLVIRNNLQVRVDKMKIKINKLKDKITYMKSRSSRSNNLLIDSESPAINNTQTHYWKNAVEFTHVMKADNSPVLVSDDGAKWQDIKPKFKKQITYSNITVWLYEYNITSCIYMQAANIVDVYVDYSKF